MCPFVKPVTTQPGAQHPLCPLGSLGVRPAHAPEVACGGWARHTESSPKGTTRHWQWKNPAPGPACSSGKVDSAALPGHLVKQ